MLGFFVRQDRNRRKKQRGRRRRGKRTGQIVAATALVATALSIPVITGVTDGDPSTADTSNAAATTDPSSDSSSLANAVSNAEGGEGLSAAGDSSIVADDSSSTPDGGESAMDSGTCAGSSTVAGSSSTSGDVTDWTNGDSTGNSTGAVVVASSAEDASSSGTITSNDASGAANDQGSQTTSGSLAGYVLIYAETPAETEPSPSNSSSTTKTSGNSGTGSSFDGEPAGELTKIEEDWELTVTQADWLISAPQIGTVMTPFDDADDIYWAFALNHRVNSSFAAGGMELQLWYQGQLLGWYTLGSEVMSTMNEKVTWTQRLEIQGGKLRFAVVNGQSDTWGTFGQGESLHLDITTTLSDLNDYHPKVSIDNSGVMFAANRVGTLILKAVRGYDKDGTLVSEDTNPVTVFGGASP